MTRFHREPRLFMRIAITLAVLLGICGVLQAQDWEAQTSGTSEVLNGVWFLDVVRGYAVGNAGTVLETEDGGLTWAPLLLTVDDMLDVAFVDDSTGLVVGDNGTIFRTTNAGQDWVQVASGTGNNLAGVAFGAGGLAYAAGRDGTIVRSTDSGSSWSLVETGVDRYRAVAAYDDHAWVVGNSGALRVTDNGGATWTSPGSGTDSDLHDVVFVSTNEGWITGQNNTVFYTDDGAATLSSRNSGIGIGLNAVFFGNSDLGWIAGGVGNAFRSVNGGLVWDNEPTPTMDALNRLHFSDAFHGWAVGENGTILTRVVPSVTLSVSRNAVEWDAFPGDPPVYDVIRGDLGTLLATQGDFATATDACLAPGVSVTSVAFSDDPAGAGDGFWFLVRVNTGATGTYDSGSFLQSGFRDAEVAGSGAACP